MYYIAIIVIAMPSIPCIRRFRFRFQLHFHSASIFFAGISNVSYVYRNFVVVVRFYLAFMLLCCRSVIIVLLYYYICYFVGLLKNSLRNLYTVCSVRSFLFSLHIMRSILALVLCFLVTVIFSLINGTKRNLSRKPLENNKSILTK